MARKLEDIFNECYERIRAGESLQSCLARYPEYHAELKSLLETAFDIGRRASYIHPRPEFKHWAQVRLQGAQHYHTNQQMQVEQPGPSFWQRQIWAVAATAVLILMLTTGSTMAASLNALPGETLYPLKMATEEVSLALAVNDTQKAEVQVRLVNERAKEVEILIDKGQRDEASLAAERLIAQLEEANSAIAKVESTVAESQPITITLKPAPIPTPEPAPIPTPEPAPIPTPEPAPIPTPEPAPIPTPEPAPIPTPEPAPIPTPEPASTATTEPVSTTTTEPVSTTTTEPVSTTTTEPVSTATTEPVSTTTTEPATTITTTTDKYNKWVAERERMKDRMEESREKAKAALRDAREKALEQDKKHYDRLIDRISSKRNHR